MTVDEVAGIPTVVAVGAAIAGTYAAVAYAPTLAGTSADDRAAAPSVVAGTAIAAGGAVQMTLWIVAHCRR